MKKLSSHGSTAVAERMLARERRIARAVEPAFSQQDAKLLLSALTALKQGDSSIRLPLEWTGMQGRLADAFNEVVDLNGRMAE